MTNIMIMMMSQLRSPHFPWIKLNGESIYYVATYKSILIASLFLAANKTPLLLLLTTPLTFLTTLYLFRYSGKIKPVFLNTFVFKYDIPVTVTPWYSAYVIILPPIHSISILYCSVYVQSIVTKSFVSTLILVKCEYMKLDCQLHKPIGDGNQFVK